MKPTTSIHFDTRRAKTGNTYPLKLRITHLRTRKYYSIGIDLTPLEWKKINSPKPRAGIKKIKARTTEILKKADNIVEALDIFSFSAFEKQYFQTKTKSLDLEAAFNICIEELTNQERINTAESYRNAINSLLEYKKQLRLNDITPEFLNQYERWMLHRRKSITTVGIYLRSLRTIINIAIEDGLLKQEQYPFGKRKYLIPKGQNIKKALTLEEIKKLYYYPAEANTPLEKARDFWVLSYMANGINFKDICRLKFGNIHNDTITFYRSKTERTKRSNPTPIVVIITEDIKRIIDKWGNTEKQPENYVFPIISKDISVQQERKLIKQFIKTTNKWLCKIVTEIGFTTNVTTYSARHSFSSILRNGGAPIEYIKESLGHNSTQTTENYLNAYPDEMKRKFTEQLTVFKRAS